MEKPSESSITNSEQLAPIEQLPAEILRKIIESAPESVRELTLTSRLIRSRVHEFVSSSMKIPIVDRTLIINREPSGLNVWLHIPKSKTGLFEMRLQFLQAPDEFKKSLKRYFNVLPDHPNQYFIEVDKLCDTRSVEILRNCLGAHIEDTSFSNFDEQMMNVDVPTLIEGVRLARTEIFIDTLFDETAERMLLFIKSHKVEQLFLTVRTVKCSDPVSFLLELSNLVLGLHITQIYSPDHGVSIDASYFFGAKDVDWASTIIGMYSKRLDTLTIRNNYTHFLSRRSSDTLRERLPFIDKKIILDVNCKAYANGLLYTVGEYVVKADGERSHLERRFLTVKHSSRQGEIFEF